MHYEIKFGPAFSLLSMDLEQGETVVYRSGAMVSKSVTVEEDVRVNTEQQGGAEPRHYLGALFGSSPKGESMFMVVATARNEAGHLAVAPAMPGDIVAVTVGRRALVMRPGGCIACIPDPPTLEAWRGTRSVEGVESRTQWRGTIGSGTVFLAGFGGLYSQTLSPGEQYMVKKDHIVAFEEGMSKKSNIEAVEFTGPGTVWVQTRSLEAFGSCIRTLVPG